MDVSVLQTQRSKVSLRIHNKEIGQQFSTESTRSFLWTGVTLTLFHSDGMRAERKG